MMNSSAQQQLLLARIALSQAARALPYSGTLGRERFQIARAYAEDLARAIAAGLPLPKMPEEISSKFSGRPAA